MTQQEINSTSMLKVGTILHSTYRIDNYLSSGGFGNTYVATNIEFEERVAIKEFFMKGVTQRDDNQTTVSVSNAENKNSFLEQKEKFKKEARRIRKLKNEHIVSVHDLFDENGTAYYVMDFVDGENLAERLKRTGKPMTEQEVREILPQALDALKSVHDAGIWHLDLKPANIMLDKSGNVKLIDFGASKQLNTQKGGATTSTAITYTNGYAPREQMEQNYDKFGPWTDIYALGATLYNLLTNNKPPLPTDIDDDMSEDKHVALPFPESVGGMKYLVLQMMKTNRLQRPQSIDAIINAEKTRKEEPKQTPKHNPTSQKATAYDDEATIFEEGISIDLLNKKALEGESQAQYMLGIRYERGGDIDHAIKWFAYSAQNGNVKAMDQIIEYANRQIRNLHLEEVSKNQQDSLFVKANNGNANAQYFIGLRYMHGIGEKKSKNEAIKWFTMSAKQGEMRAMEKLVELLTNCGGLFYVGEYLSKRN